MRTWRTLLGNERGVALVLALMMLLALTGLLLAFLSVSSLEPQISRNLADFLWLESMSVTGSRITIAGKASTYTAVSNFYNNLAACGWFDDVVMGKASEIPEGVGFSLTCTFKTPQAAPEAGAEAASQQASQTPAPVQPRG